MYELGKREPERPGVTRCNCTTCQVAASVLSCNDGEQLIILNIPDNRGFHDGLNLSCVEPIVEMYGYVVNNVP